MQKDERDLLEILKSELEFLEQGGYRRSPETAWRPKFIFEDSPSCINYDSAEDRIACTDCALIYLVPPAHRSAKSPCRHIPLNKSGETLDSLYRYGTQSETESAVGTWLRAAITRWKNGGGLLRRSTIGPNWQERPSTQNNIRNVQTRHARPPFIGPEVASSSGLEPVPNRKPAAVQQVIGRQDFTG